MIGLYNDDLISPLPSSIYIDGGWSMPFVLACWIVHSEDIDKHHGNLQECPKNILEYLDLSTFLSRPCADKRPQLSVSVSESPTTHARILLLGKGVRIPGNAAPAKSPGAAACCAPRGAGQAGFSNVEISRRIGRENLRNTELPILINLLFLSLPISNPFLIGMLGPVTVPI